jgi:hypothetical protein
MGKGLAVPDETGEMRIANGVAMIDSSELDETAAAIAEVAQTRNGIKFKFHDKRAALMDIGRHLGMFPRMRHSPAPSYRKSDVLRLIAGRPRVRL